MGDKTPVGAVPTGAFFALVEVVALVEGPYHVV